MELAEVLQRLESGRGENLQPGIKHDKRLAFHTTSSFEKKEVPYFNEFVKFVSSILTQKDKLAAFLSFLPDPPRSCA